MFTWLVTMLAWRWLPAEHPWKKRGRRFTLDEWRVCRTPLCCAMDEAGMFCIGFLVACLAMLALG